MLLTLLACLLVQAPPSDAAKKARTDLDTVRGNIEKMMKLRERHQQLGEEDAKLREQLQAGSDDEERLKKLAKKRTVATSGRRLSTSTDHAGRLPGKTSTTFAETSRAPSLGRARG